ncbi:MAG: GntR family transcriptional regulator [Nitratireductor sp.]|nr:GntR family transcriptional regulator [Nitratireductor sp.]MCB1455510.1 GntR family transcriptional regulator [Nitratireductor sp.]MCB1458075.1 GntR family transcriptional regulator [Nitratireductor sp.]
MPPGFQAPEPEIALRLGMSRTPVREALIRLESEGLVRLIPRHGALVLPVAADDMREIYEILTALEPEAAASLARKQPDRASLDALEAATRAMEAALRDNDLDAWAEADDRFHRTLLMLHANNRMTNFVSSLFDQVHRARMTTLRLRKPPEQSTREHREILEHILAGDAEKARKSFRAHRERAAAELLSILQSHDLQAL